MEDNEAGEWLRKNSWMGGTQTGFASSLTPRSVS